MFICRDVSQEYLLSVYWEEDHLIIVVKQATVNGELLQVSAEQYSAAAAAELMQNMIDGSRHIQKVTVNQLNALAISGRIAEGLRTRTAATSSSRITPEMWN